MEKRAGQYDGGFDVYTVAIDLIAALGEMKQADLAAEIADTVCKVLSPKRAECLKRNTEFFSK